MALSIGDLEINPRIITAVKNAGFHDGRAVMNLSSAEVERLTGLSVADVTHLKDVISQTVLGQSAVTCLQLWQAEDDRQACRHRLSTGCALLDRALRGGLLLRGLTEVTGESGTGKTQLCLQLCLTVQLPPSHGGLGGGAIYISTEGAFPNRRMNQMAQHFSRQHCSVLKRSVMDCVLLEHVADLEGLKDCLQRKLPMAVSRRGVKLVVVDSVTALFRCDSDSHSLVGRAKQLAALAMALRRLADQHSVAVVCVNQVTANMSKVSDGPGPLRQSIPALGLVWADHVTCRLLMSRREDALSSSSTLCGAYHSKEGPTTIDQAQMALTSKRQLEVVFAPHLAPTVVPLVISRKGITHESAGV
ncbi:DNA repair protein XRCC3-like [Babylonia areolata]|uniref:DNA repair protein XRCC3-like n=1 Tax=Babylonia areolata TaxID=304850 RepID=UPI003FD1842F